MPVTLTEEQQDFANAIGEFARREVPDKARRDELTAEGPHSMEVYRKMADQGWLGIALPEAYGGSGGSMTDLLVFLEETSYHQIPIGGFGTTIITAAALERSGSEEQKQQLLGDVINGELLAISMSEPGAGSDVGGLTCKAEKTENGWVVNGQKTWCSNAHISKHILLVARTSDRGRQARRPDDVHGADRRRRAGDARHRDDGRQGGQRPLLHRLPPARRRRRGHRGAGLAPAHGRAQPRAHDPRRADARRSRAARSTTPSPTSRSASSSAGRSARFQALRHRIADNATELAATKLLVHDTARTIDANPGALFPREASMAKLKATELAKHLSLEGMQMLGGYGYATEYGMERLLRQSVVSTVYGGTSEIQRDIIGKSYGL